MYRPETDRAIRAITACVALAALLAGCSDIYLARRDTIALGAGNDIDFFLMGQAEVSPALARLALGQANRTFVGHVLDLRKNGGVYVTAKD